MAEKTTEKATETTPAAKAKATRETHKIDAFVNEFATTPKQIEEMREAFGDDRTTVQSFIERFLPKYDERVAHDRLFKSRVEKVID